MDFDATDRRILEILREDGRASHAFIAKQVRVSAPTVGERIRKLEQAGVIVGYRAVLDHHALDLGVAAYVWVAPQPRKPAASLVKRLSGMPEIEQLHSVAGPYSFLLLVRVRNTRELDSFLDRLFMLEGVERTETTMVLSTAVDRPAYLPFLLDEADSTAD